MMLWSRDTLSCFNGKNGHPVLFMLFFYRSFCLDISTVQSKDSYRKITPPKNTLSYVRCKYHFTHIVLVCDGKQKKVNKQKTTTKSVEKKICQKKVMRLFFLSLFATPISSHWKIKTKIKCPLFCVKRTKQALCI